MKYVRLKGGYMQITKRLILVDTIFCLLVK